MEKYDGTFMKGRCKECCKLLLVMLISITGCMAKLSIIPESTEKYALSGQNTTLTYTIQSLLKEKNLEDLVDKIRFKIEIQKKPTVSYAMLFQIKINKGKKEIERQNADEGMPLKRYVGRARIEYKQPNVVFYLENVMAEDFGWNYQVEAINSKKRQFGGANKKNIILRQAEPPKILDAKFFPNDMMKLGFSNTFKCRASGVPTPTVQWMIGDNIIGSYGREEASMPITEAKTTDSKNYVCEAKNVGGVAKKTLSLTVAYIVYDGEDKSKSEVKDIEVGNEVSAKCNIDGYPSPKYKWFDPRNFVIRSTRGLDIKITTTERFGNYTCQAENHAGTLKYVVQVKQVGGKKGQITEKTKDESKDDNKDTGDKVDTNTKTPVVSQTEKLQNSAAPPRTSNWFLFCILHSLLLISTSFIFT